MTQTIQVETGAGSSPVASRLPSQQGSSPSAVAGDTLFALLLAMAQNLPTAEGEQQATAVPADGLLPEQQKPLSAGEIEQAAASLGLPLPVAGIPFVQSTPLPEAHSPDIGTPLLSVQQVAFLPQVVTDAPPPAALSAEASAEPGGEGIVPTPLSAGDEPAALTAQGAIATSEPAQSAQKIPSVASALPLHDTDSGDITSPAPAVPSASGAQTLPENNKEMPHPFSEGSAAAPTAQNPAVAQAQADRSSQMQSEDRHERQIGTPTISRGTRSQTKKPTAFEIGEKPSTRRLPEAYLHGVQSMETASVVHRTPETVVQPSEVSPAEVVRQVARQIETMTSQRSTSSVTLQLEPEHLGRLRVTISVNDGAIHTHIVADNHAVRQMLESNSTLLQQALQERGLQLGALQVSVQGDGRQFLLHQPYTPPPSARGWLEAEAAVHAISEVNLGRTTPGGINLLA
ncbi:MAG: flagellar hook-length control protein FliK [Armatimonadota bacterium]